MKYFKWLSRGKSTQGKKGRLIKGNELKVTEVDLLLFFILKNEVIKNIS